MFGNYYAYDSVAPVADALQRLLGFSDTQLGTLNAIYSLPNVIMVLVGGVIVDRFGTRLSTLLFALVCLVGAVLTALSPLFPVMAAGRLIFGTPVVRWTGPLARISPQLSAAASDSGMPTVLRSVGRLDVLSSTPAAPSRRAPCIHARLRHLATKPGAKSG